MNKLLVFISFLYSIIPFIYLFFLTKEYNQYLFSFYALSLSFSFYLIFSVIIPKSEEDKAQFVKKLLISYSFLTFSLVNIIVASAVIISTNDNFPLSIFSVFSLFLIILLSYVFNYLSPCFEKSIGKNSLLIIINTLILIPLFLQNKFSFFDRVFNFSILNSPIDYTNMLTSIPVTLAVILFQLYLLKRF